LTANTAIAPQLASCIRYTSHLVTFFVDLETHCGISYFMTYFRRHICCATVFGVL